MSFPHMGPVVASLVIIGVFFVLSSLLKTAIQKIGEFKQVPTKRYEHVYKYFRAILIVLASVVFLLVWGVDYKGLVVVASSILALLAVALVAQWSILSNVTAGVLIFFTFPSRIGDWVEIVDGASTIKGEILEINLFQILIKDENKQVVAYPNNLLLQKPVRKLSKNQKTEESQTQPSINRRLANRKK